MARLRSHAGALISPSPAPLGRPLPYARLCGMAEETLGAVPSPPLLSPHFCRRRSSFWTRTYGFPYVIPPVLNWDLGSRGLQDLPHKAQTIFPLLPATTATPGPAPSPLPPALVETSPGGAWRFLLIPKHRSISTDLIGIFFLCFFFWEKSNKTILLACLGGGHDVVPPCPGQCQEAQGPHGHPHSAQRYGAGGPDAL